MPKTKPRYLKQNVVQVGDVTDINGNVNIAGGNVITYKTATGLSADEIKRLFDQLYSAIDVRMKTPPSTKRDLKDEIKEIQSTVAEAVEKNTKVEKSLLSRRFRNIARMAPDILDVIVATLASPLAGLGIAVKKIAEKAKEEIK
jgi:cell division septum initiation protein DivIVA